MKLRSQAAFTLIELLVVITIIGILAGIALPAMQNAQVSARQVAVLSNIKQIVTAMNIYGQDNDAKFPSMPTNADGVPLTTGTLSDSNQAFSQLFPAYLTNENIFYCPNSAWTLSKPDGSYDTKGASGAVNTLKAGENHFAYFPGLNTGSNSNWPLVCDGFAEGALADPAYVANKSVKGGVWGGKVALVGHSDASVEKVKLNSTFKATRKKSGGGAEASYFAPDTTDPEWFSTPALNPRS